MYSVLPAWYSRYILFYESGDYFVFFNCSVKLFRTLWSNYKKNLKSDNPSFSPHFFLCSQTGTFNYAKDNVKCASAISLCATGNLGSTGNQIR